MLWSKNLMLDDDKLKNVRFESAMEIISLKQAVAISNNTFEEIKKLEEEKTRLYSGDEKMIEKVLNQYGIELKVFLRGKDNE